MGTERIESSRRKFIKSFAAAAGGGFAFTLLNPSGILLYAASPVNESGPWYGIGIDIQKCIGCGRCAGACKVENNVPREPFFFRTWIEQYTIKNDGEVIVESPNGGVDGFEQKIPEEEIFKSFFVPKMCNHCFMSPCVQVCPVGATYDSPEGVVLVDDKQCIGCRYCVQACPYGCRYIHPEKKVVDKCTLCYHRIKKGLSPACIEVCPTGARIFGDLNDKEGVMVEFLKENTCQVLKPHLNTGSKLYYNALSSEVR
ncbi:MAG: 4Fe-4S dicluster domain-containing protein [Bacteroidales bacterium]|nr:4Fe-4S dicluster domain-containing protein [Bacteroidales bacterium]